MIVQFEGPDDERYAQSEGLSLCCHLWASILVHLVLSGLWVGIGGCRELAGKWFVGEGWSFRLGLVTCDLGFTNMCVLRTVYEQTTKILLFDWEMAVYRERHLSGEI